MSYETRIGRWLFAAACVAFGAQSLMFAKFVGGLEFLPSSGVPALPWAFVNGGVLIVAGLAALAISRMVNMRRLALLVATAIAVIAVSFFALGSLLGKTYGNSPMCRPRMTAGNMRSML